MRVLLGSNELLQCVKMSSEFGVLKILPEGLPRLESLLTWREISDVRTTARKKKDRHRPRIGACPRLRLLFESSGKAPGIKLSTSSPLKVRGRDREWCSAVWCVPLVSLENLGEGWRAVSRGREEQSCGAVTGGFVGGPSIASTLRLKSSFDMFRKCFKTHVDLTSTTADCLFKFYATDYLG